MNKEKTIKIFEDAIKSLEEGNNIKREKLTYIINEEEKNRILGMAIDNEFLKLKNEWLQDRIDKAIDYIEMVQYNESYEVKEENYFRLLDILRGDSND